MLTGCTVIALTYGALGLLLGVLVKRDLEGVFLIILGGLMDTGGSRPTATGPWPYPSPRARTSSPRYPAGPLPGSGRGVNG